eukprot:s163_g5.t1
MSLSWLLALTLSRATDLPVTVSREPLRFASHDTGCILERMKVQYTCELKEFTPQLMVFRIDCQSALDFRKFKLWDAQHLCAHLTYEQSADHRRGEGSHEVDSFVLEKGDVVQFRCILLPLNFSSSHSVFHGTMNVAFLEEKETAEEHITAFELVLPDECRAAVANVYEWLLTVYKSKQNTHTLLWQSPKLSVTSPGIKDSVGLHQGLLWRDEFLNPQIASVACKKLPGINLKERVRVLRSNLSVVDFRDTDNSTWFGVHFDIDVNVTSLPEDTQDLQVVVNFSLHRNVGDFVPSSYEQMVSVPVEMAQDTASARAKRSFWFRFIIFILLALLVVAVALRLYACHFACDRALPQAQARPPVPALAPPREIELRTTS